MNFITKATIFLLLLSGCGPAPAPKINPCVEFQNLKRGQKYEMVRLVLSNNMESPDWYHTPLTLDDKNYPYLMFQGLTLNILIYHEVCFKPWEDHPEMNK